MIQITPQMRILVCIEPVDFRSGIDRLSCICRQALGADPFSGTVFVFCNRSRTALRVLCYDGQGFWLCHKRLSKGRITAWPKDSSIEAHQLQSLLWNLYTPQGAVNYFRKLP